jgi:hypothetical protein
VTPHGDFAAHNRCASDDGYLPRQFIQTEIDPTRSRISLLLQQLIQRRVGWSSPSHNSSLFCVARFYEPP